MFYYCTCDRKNPRVEARSGYKPYRMVEVDEEGICKDCGYYAIAAKIAIKASGDLYSYLFKSRGEPTLKVQTGNAKTTRNLKFTEEEIIQIREMYEKEHYLQKDLAEKFGTSRSMISNIIKRKIYNHI